MAKYFSPHTPIAVIRLGAIYNIGLCAALWPVLLLGCAQLQRMQLVALLPSIIFAFMWPKFLHSPSPQLSRIFLVISTCALELGLMWAGYKWLLRVAICAVIIAFLLEMLRGGQRENLVLSLGSNLAGLLILVLGMTWGAGLVTNHPAKQQLCVMLLVLLAALPIPCALWGFTVGAIGASLIFALVGALVLGISVGAIGIGMALLCAFWVVCATIILCHSVKFIPVPSASAAIAFALALPLSGGMAFTVFLLAA